MGCNAPQMPPEPERPGQRKVFCVKFQREMPVDGSVLRAGNCGEQKQDEKSLQEGHSLHLAHLLPGHAGADHTPSNTALINVVLITLFHRR